MAVYVVTWSLNKKRDNDSSARAEFLEQFERYETKSDSGLETTRFVSTAEHADAIVRHLQRNIDEGDRLIVSQLHRGEYQGWLKQEVWDWISARL